jgi:hypothetical protein
MGCDIHMYIETRVGDGEWQADQHHQHIIDDDGDHYIPAVNATGRNYQLFADLANVRGEGMFGLEPLGLPDDVSDIVNKASDDWDVDGHSHSYISLKDFIKILKKHKEYNLKNKDERAFYNWDDIGEEEDFPNYVSLVNYCKRLIDNHKAEAILLGQKRIPPLEVRLVFWFDN